MTDQLDLSQEETAEEAAKALHSWLQDYAEELGHSRESVVLYSPEEAAPKRDGHAAWTVAWEGGPYEWATALTAGESMLRRELGEYGGTPQVTGFYNEGSWIAEPFYSFDLQFTDY